MGDDPVGLGGIVVSMLQTIGILSEDGRLLDTTVSVVAGITYNFLPFMILPLYASLERIDPRMLEAATTSTAAGATCSCA